MKNSSFFKKIEFILKYLFSSYFNRLKLGEGGLVVFSFIHIFLSYNNGGIILLECLMSFATMSMMYLYNDFVDKKQDVINPKKNQQTVRMLIEYPKVFYVIQSVVLILILLLSYFLFNEIKVLLILSLLLINAMYSHYLKSFPIVDILIVSIWGGSYFIAFGTFDLTLALIVGAMTGIAHIYQTKFDYEVDRLSNVKTSAVVSSSFPVYAIQLLVLMLGFLFYQYHVVLACSVVVLLVLFFVKRLTLLNKWHLSRMYFVLSFLLIRLSFSL